MLIFNLYFPLLPGCFITFSYYLYVIIKQQLSKYILKMNIPKKTIDEWRKYIDHGEQPEIAKIAKVSVRTVNTALNEGRASGKTIKAILKFVNKKKLLLVA